MEDNHQLKLHSVSTLSISGHPMLVVSANAYDINVAADLLLFCVCLIVCLRWLHCLCSHLVLWCHYSRCPFSLPLLSVNFYLMQYILYFVINSTFLVILHVFYTSALFFRRKFICCCYCLFSPLFTASQQTSDSVKFRFKSLHIVIGDVSSIVRVSLDYLYCNELMRTTTISTTILCSPFYILFYFLTILRIVQ